MKSEQFSDNKKKNKAVQWFRPNLVKQVWREKEWENIPQFEKFNKFRNQ